MEVLGLGTQSVPDKVKVSIQPQHIFLYDPQAVQVKLQLVNKLYAVDVHATEAPTRSIN